MVMPAAATIFEMSGRQVACSPISKNVPLTHMSVSALITIGVFSGHGPSSKVSTTSLSRRKSYCLKCSVPNAGPPVVSISTARARPMPSGLSHAGALFAGAGAGAAAPCGAAAAGGGGVLGRDDRSYGGGVGGHCRLRHLGYLILGEIGDRRTHRCRPSVLSRR